MKTEKEGKGGGRKGEGKESRDSWRGNVRCRGRLEEAERAESNSSLVRYDQHACVCSSSCYY